MFDFEKTSHLFRQEIGLSAEEAADFIAALKYREYRRRQIILHEGDICSYEYFVLYGIPRLYFIDENGLEHTLMFARENSWISDFDSYFNQTPATLNIDVLEDVGVLQLSIKNRDELFRKIPKLERYARLKIQDSLVESQQRIIDTMSLPSKERYLKFLSEKGGIEQRVPQHYIASYLGITPQFLSKIRADLRHNVKEQKSLYGMMMNKLPLSA